MAVVSQPCDPSCDVPQPGAVDAQLRAVIDHRGQLAKQRFTIHCPRLVHQEYVLGRDDQWALQVARGAASCWIDLEFSGDELTGELRWRYDPKEAGRILAAEFDTRARNTV